MLASWKKSYDQPRQTTEKHRHYLADKGLFSQCYGFSCSHVWMTMHGWELDYKESWAQKNWSFWTVVLEETFESPLDCRKIRPVNPKWNQPWIFIENTGAEAEAPILWLPNTNSQLIIKVSDGGKACRQKEKRMTGWIVEWCHWLNGHEFEENLGDVERQGSLQSMLSQTVRYNWVTVQQQISLKAL